jgi:hypothetical protein
MDYKIITKSSPQGLEEEVKKCINSGWKPLGNPTVIQGRDEHRRWTWTSSATTGSHTVYVTFMQALIKEEK